ncbi:MAG: hypothetical protein HETSPECPRED_009739 [Heterodermia speciosa]|uniref:Uncharacterized protein n=1 Tax=Heterodermia speciosa TaxID=116794 RepID=A0A8H3IWB5_9LECA|nr:MAG: hypothetical protein HETSPECPRED_009739 [Heterodermia speciosa]
MPRDDPRYGPPSHGYGGGSRHGSAPPQSGGGHRSGGHRGGGFPPRAPPCSRPEICEDEHEPQYAQFISDCYHVGINSPRELGEALVMGGGPLLAVEPDILGRLGLFFLKHYRLVTSETMDNIRHNIQASHTGGPYRGISRGGGGSSGRSGGGSGGRSGGMGAGMGGMPGERGSRGGRGGSRGGGMSMGGGGRGSMGNLHGSNPPGGHHRGNAYAYDSTDEGFDTVGDDYGQWSGDEGYGHGGHGRGGGGHGGRGHNAYESDEDDY